MASSYSFTAASSPALSPYMARARRWSCSTSAATVAVLHAIGVWNELVLATIFLTSSDLFPITRGLIVFNGVYGNNWPVLAAAVLMIAAPMAVFFVFMQRFIIGGVTAGAVKG